MVLVRGEPHWGAGSLSESKGLMKRALFPFMEQSEFVTGAGTGSPLLIPSNITVAEPVSVWATHLFDEKRVW